MTDALDHVLKTVPDKIATFKITGANYRISSKWPQMA